MELRPYQNTLSLKANEILNRLKLVCLFMEVRTGKTITALETCKLFGAKKVLFITKIKAFTSIKNDYKNFDYNFELTIINRESLHKIVTNDFDVVVIDEVHGYTSYPKPSKYYKEVKSRFGNLPMIMLSGTPTPESYSQYYHLFTLSNNSNFKEYKNFYRWANDFVDIEKKNVGYAIVNNYSKANKTAFWHLIKDNILTFTQSEAGFTTDVKENILTVKMLPITYAIIKRLIKDFVVISSTTGKEIIADTGVKLQQKTHQLFSGTIKYDDGSYQIIDNSKAIFIQNHFANKKIAIFYNFIAELEMLKQTFGNQLTTDLNEFNSTDKNIALQYQSGKEGISLAKADCLIAFNICFSSSTYWQFRDRLTTIDRKENNIFWIFCKNGIEEKIYKRVLEKKEYTLSCFRKDYNTKEVKK